MWSKLIAIFTLILLVGLAASITDGVLASSQEGSLSDSRRDGRELFYEAEYGKFLAESCTSGNANSLVEKSDELSEWMC